ncbi:hypothetical protein LNAOJCKE_4328 [Methylorubrum aminovorans]|uniref:Glycosyltransferase subfamily 4-like N-terminal domain-containing protein n=1 Tax=Methylorubrum aminovorans TaxID=269069 RepID=A0ABQ4UL99_9HYPH|nr:hypothetical protein [Methylorubrum aminovorans]GJE67102.1 hypothetical protein LNAOJCKE_4328 [Methylorubrum aminovorans]GMA77796.1 hypothetical protein GCM10025880_42130 [Methylorubrum aminovorans]
MTIRPSTPPPPGSQQSGNKAEPPYQSRIDAYRGIPVFRIARPRERNMGWRSFNPSARSQFESLLDRFEPDLVYVHCVQQLTASAVEAVRDRKIPDTVTVHDVWWISDFHSLIDEDGLVQMPTPDILADATGCSVTPTGSIAGWRGCLTRHGPPQRYRSPSPRSLARRAFRRRLRFRTASRA